MKAVLGFVVGALLFVGLAANAQTIPSVSPWLVDAMNRITQRVAGTPVYINGDLTVTGICTGCGSSSSGLATSTPWTIGNLVQVLTNGSVTSIATSSLGIDISDTTGTLSVSRGGTSSTTLSGILRGNGTSQVSTTVIGSGLSFDGTTLSATGGSSGTISTSTPLVSGQVDFSTGVNTIGNDSAFFWDNTNKRLGIGTTTPTGKLVVQGSGTGNVAIGEWSGNPTYGAISLNGSLVPGFANFYSAGTSLFINRPSGAIDFRANDVSQMYLSSTGNVGIGTTTPGSKLDVYGDLRVGTRTSGSYRYIDFVGGSASATIQARRADTAAAVDLTIQTAGGNTLLNPTTGNVGIATTSPYLSSFSGLSIGGTNPAIALGATGGKAYFLTSLASDSSFRLYDDATQTYRLTVSSAGLFGIGTTSPSQLLSVQGNAFFSGNISNVANITAIGTINALTALQINGADLNTAGTLTNVAYLNQAQAFSALQTFSAGASTTQLTATSGLYLASGSDYLLRTSGANFDFSIPNGSGGMFRFRDGTAGTIHFVIDESNSHVGVGTSTPYAKLSVRGDGTSTGVNFQTTNSSDSPLFTILDSGNVGVGTTSPISKLAVNGRISGIDNASPWGGLFGGTGGAQAVVLGNSGGVATVQGANDSFASNATTLAINPLGGNVGIGTTSPLAKLEVTGTGVVGLFGAGTASDSAYIGFNHAGTAGTARAQFGYNGTTGNAVVQGTAGKGIEFNVNNSFGAGQAMVITSAGNVGIGTTSPQYKLDVEGNGAVAAFGNSSSQDQYIQIRKNAGLSFFGLDVSLNGGSGGTLVQSGASKSLNFAVGSDTFGAVTPSMVITSGGNVGVGTTTPLNIPNVSERLVVTGDIFADNIANDTGLSLGSLGTGGSYIQSSNAGNTTSKSFTLQPSGGNVGIGTTSPLSTLDIAEKDGATVPSNLLSLTHWSAGGNAGPILNMRVEDGGTAVDGGETLGRLSGWGSYASRAFVEGARIDMTAEGGFTSSSAPSYITLSTTASGSVTPTERLRVTSAGNVGIGTSSPSATLAIQGTINQPQILLKTPSTQTANVLEIDNSSNVPLFQFTNGGHIAINKAPIVTDTIINVSGGSNERVDTTGTARGLNMSVINGSSGNIIGLQFTGETRYAGTVSSMVGIQAGVITNNAGATLTNGFGYLAQSPSIIAGAVTNAYGFYAQAQNVSGVSKPYGFYQAGTSDLNYFGAWTGIGTTTPSAMLSIEHASTTNSRTFTISSTTAASRDEVFTVLTNPTRVGIATSSPGSILSIGASGAGINFSTATSTFTGVGGINITSGCFAINGVCVGGSGSSYTATYPVTLTGSDFGLAFGTTTSNTWAGTQTFTNPIAVPAGSIANASLTNSTISGVALGGNLADLSALDTTLTFSGNYNGSTARTIGLNLGNANTWSGLQTFGNTGTTTFSGGIQAGTIVAAPYFNATSTTATSTFSGGILASFVEIAGNVLARAGTLLDFSNATVRQHTYPAFTYATSTAWTGTTTIPLGVAYTQETWTGVKCFTDTGTLAVSFNDGTNRMNYIPTASTTVNLNVLSTNNSLAANTKRYVDIGSPASSPTKISCSVDKIVNQ